MKKSSLLCAAVLSACALSAQPSFQTSLQAGISLPLNSNEINGTHAGKAIHFGNHLDYTFGNNSVRFGLGAYVGYINSIAADNKYKEIGEAIAEKYRFNTSFLTFNASSFKSAHVLIGPVASFGADKLSINIWAKGGYGLNEPSRYAVIYKENGAVNNNIYISQGGENKNGIAYNAGAGVKLAISQYVGLQLSAAYFSTQTDQVNYNFDREKGTTPLYYTASNQFIEASAGLQFTIGNPGKKTSTSFSPSQYAGNDTDFPINARPDQKIKTKSNIKNDRLVNNNNGTDPDFPINARPDQKIKTKSNIKNDRMANNAGNDADEDADSDSLLFTPSKIELRSKITDPEASRVQLQSVDNYLTGFVYKGNDGAMISQCGASAMPGEPIPGIDVKLKSMSGATSPISARTNKDGSFAFNNIAPGDYAAEAGDAKMDVTVNGSNDNAFRTLDVMGGSCGDTKENYIINAGDKTYVEVIAAREASSGMATGKKHVGNVKYEDIKVTMGAREAGSGLATGKRMHKPYRVTDTDFDIATDKIYTSDGKLYAEVITSRDASSGMATGRRMIVTGDIDGDGIQDNAILSPRDAASGLPTGKRMHKPYVITKELDRSYEVVSPRDAASGLPTGKRMHKPFVITKELDAAEIVSPRDAASGLPTGKRMHKPFVITIQEPDEDDDAMDLREAGSGMATGKRMHQPFVVRINPDEDSYEVISPRDAASGLPTGKRMHKPFVITKELDYTDDGDEVVSYRVIHRDLATRNVLLNEKGIITGKDNDNGMYAESETLRAKRGYDYYQAQSDMAAARNGVTSNPLYSASGTTGVNAMNKTNGSKKGYDYYKTSSDDDVIITKNPMFQAKGTSGVNPLASKTGLSSVQNNPLYENSGLQGENPLFESEKALTVTGSNGITHDIFIPSKIIIIPVNNPPTEYSSYEVGPLKWMAPESMASKKGITEKGIKRGTAENVEANSERKGWDGSVKGSSKNINTSEAGVGTGKDMSVNVTGNTERKGWDGTVKGGAIVERVNRVNCIDGTCSVEAIVTVDGKEYEAVITGVLKTKHDTVKNSIGNIR